MHKGRIDLLERAKKAEDELFDAIEEIERVNYFGSALDPERKQIADAMKGVYRLIMIIADDQLTP